MCLDVAVQFKEEIKKKKEISFVPIVVEVGDCTEKRLERNRLYWQKFISQNKFPN